MSFGSSVIEPDVVEVGAGDRGPVDLRLHHRSAHQLVLSCSASVMTPRSVETSAPAICIVTLSIRRALPTEAATATTTSPSTLVSGARSAAVGPRRIRAPGRGAPLRLPRWPGRAPGRARRPRRPRSAARSEAKMPVARRRSSADEVGVAARHRHPVGLADERAADDLDGQVEVGGHAPHDGELLGVLAPEVGAARADDREQLGDDRGHAVEVRRTGGAAQPLGEPVDVDGGDRRLADTSRRTLGTNSTSTPSASAAAVSATRSRG